MLPSILPTRSATPEPEETKPAAAEVGDCWKADAADMAVWSSWMGDDAVDCGSRHQTYTFYVGEVNTRIDEAWNGRYMSDELAQWVNTECVVKLRKLGIPDTAARVQIFFFVAPKADWRDGDHSMRCDLAVSTIGTDWADPGLEGLPSDIESLIDDIDANPVAYEYCLTGDGYGPYESDLALIADCSGEYYWRFSENINYDTELDDPYLSDEQLFAFAEQVCTVDDARPGEEPYYYVPSEEMWDADYRYVECWYSTLIAPVAPV